MKTTFICQVIFIGAIWVSTLSATDTVKNPASFYHQKCEQSSGPKANCKLDLTVAVDMSWAMKSRKNVLNLANFTIAKVVDQYAINYQNSRVAVQTLGSWAFSQSPYFDQFGHVCEFISHAADTFPFFGNDFFQLSKVFKSYLVSNILPSPKKHVLVIFTAINDAFNINAAVPFANIVKKHAHVIIVGINQKDRKYLERIADDVIYANFNDYSVSLADKIVETTCPGSEGSNTTTTLNPGTTTTTTVSPTQTTTTGFVEPTSTVFSTAAATTESPVEFTTEATTTTENSESSTNPAVEQTTSIPQDLTTSTSVETQTTNSDHPTTANPNDPSSPSTVKPDQPSTLEPETSSTNIQPSTTAEASSDESTTLQPENPSTAEPSATTMQPIESSTSATDASPSVEPSDVPSTFSPNHPTTNAPIFTTEISSTSQPEISSSPTSSPESSTSSTDDSTTEFPLNLSSEAPIDGSTEKPSSTTEPQEPTTISNGEQSTAAPDPSTTSVQELSTTPEGNPSTTGEPEVSSTSFSQPGTQIPIDPSSSPSAKPSTIPPQDPTTANPTEPSTTASMDGSTQDPIHQSTPESSNSLATTAAGGDQSTIEQGETSITPSQQTVATTQGGEVSTDQPQATSVEPEEPVTAKTDKPSTVKPENLSTNAPIDASTVPSDKPSTSPANDATTSASEEPSTDSPINPSPSRDPPTSETSNPSTQPEVTSVSNGPTTQGPEESSTSPFTDNPSSVNPNEPSSSVLPETESTTKSDASTTVSSVNQTISNLPEEASTVASTSSAPIKSSPDVATTEASSERTTTVSQPIDPSTNKKSTSMPIEITDLPTTENPLSDALGTSCSTNTTEAWLDLVFVIDTSAVLSSTQLNQFGGLIAGLLRRFTIDLAAERSTRVGIITYAKESIVQYDLTSIKDWSALYSAFSTIGKFRQNEKVVDISQGLSAADKLLKTQKSHRIPAIVLVGASTNTDSIPAAQTLSKQIIAEGTKIVTINFAVNHDASEAPLNSLASPNFGFVSNDPQLYSKLTIAFTKVNCVCPKLTFQFHTNSDVFGDCVQGFNGQTPPDIAQLMCEMAGGILVSVTSQEKLDFIRTEVVKNVFGSNPEFTIGLHRIPANDNKWFWFGYNKTAFPLGDFKKWEDGKAPSDSAACGYAAREASDNALAFTAGGCDYEDARPYLCQTKACDSSHFCDLESGVKAANAHFKLQSEMKQRAFRSNNKRVF